MDQRALFYFLKMIDQKVLIFGGSGSLGKSLIKRLCVQIGKKDSNIKNTNPRVVQGKLKLYPSQLECEWGGKQLPNKLTIIEFLIEAALSKQTTSASFPLYCILVLLPSAWIL